MKQLGIAIWVLAVGMIVAQFFQTPKSATNPVFLYFALFTYLPLLIYSWLWGHQRGHIAHFIGIVVAGYFSILLYFREWIPELLFDIGVCAGIVVLFLVVRRYRPGFVSDYRNRIRRDHFARKE